MSLSRVHFSSKTVEWGTPGYIMDFVKREWGANIVLDVCASPANAKAGAYFSAAVDALTYPWASIANGLGGDWWMNPPYGEPEQPCKDPCEKKRCVERGWHNDVYRPGCPDFMAKAYHEAFEKKSNGFLLLPARTDTRWWHAYCEPVLRKLEPGTVLFWQGRISFINQNGEKTDPAAFPSVLVHMKGKP